MTVAHHDSRLTQRQLLLPTSLLSLAVLLLLAFQTMHVIRDRDGMNIAKGQQEQAFQDSQRLQMQLDALLKGTQKLTDEGNKNTKVITERLKSIGIQVNLNPDQAQAANAVAPAPIPAVMEPPATDAPVKP